MPQDSTVYDIRLLEKIIETQSILANAHFNLQAFMQLLVNKMHELTPAIGTVIELVEGEFMIYKTVTGTVTEHLGLKLPIANSISGLCALENRILISHDTEEDPHVNVEMCRKISARSMVVAPLVYADKSIGVLKIFSNIPNAFNELHIKILELMAGFIASGLKNQILFQEKEIAIIKFKKAQQRLSHIAKHDFLTKLPNRKFFDTVLKHALDKNKRKKGLIALMFLDIDHFKWINDNLGHTVGDKLLIKFAAVLKKHFRKYDFVFRLGGDEFVILIDDVHNEANAIKIAEEIINKLNKIVFFNNTELKVSTSIGVSFHYGEELSPAEFIRQADKALYKAKEKGRNCYSIFSSYRHIT